MDLGKSGKTAADRRPLLPREELRRLFEGIIGGAQCPAPAPKRPKRPMMRQERVARKRLKAASKRAELEEVGPER